MESRGLRPLAGFPLAGELAQALTNPSFIKSVATRPKRELFRVYHGCHQSPRLFGGVPLPLKPLNCVSGEERGSEVLM